jgi:hypothetical protein
MYPGASQNQKQIFKQNLKTNVKSQLFDYVLCVRNGYIMPLYYVMRSTRFFNPISKTRIHRKKNEYIDPDFKWVSLEDQRKVYQLFGFGGTTHSQMFDDSLRNELQDILKDILFQPTSTALKNLVLHLLRRMDIDITQHIETVERICLGLSQRPEFSHKSYKLPEKWYYNTTWKKVQQYNEPIIIGGEGGRGAVEQLIATF